MDPLKMYFLLKMGIFQPAMLVYWRVYVGIFPKILSESGFCLEIFYTTTMGWRAYGRRKMHISQVEASADVR